MKRQHIFILCLITLMACKKSKEGDGPQDSKNGPVINFTQIGQTTSSAIITRSFTSNRTGNAFLLTGLDEENRSQTYYGNGDKWEKLGTFQPSSAAVSDNGVAIYFEHQGQLKRYDGNGNPETVPLSNFNYSRIEIGADGNFYVGSSNGNILKSTDEGKTWGVTEIPQNRFNYAGNLAVGFFVHPDGIMYSYTGGGRIYQSKDAGKNWSTFNITVDYSNTGYTDIYSPISHDNHGNIYILGSKGISIISTINLNSRSVSLESTGLASTHERIERFTSDAQGDLYATVSSKGFDYEFQKRATPIYKFSDHTWRELPTPSPYIGFSDMHIYSTDAGIVSAANGLLSKGLYSINASEKYMAIGTPQELENILIDISPVSNGKVFGIMQHPTPIGTTLNAALNPAYTYLLVLENGQWKHTGKAADRIFVASNGDIYAIHNVYVSLSKDAGKTWQTSTLTIDDPLNLRNFIQAKALHFTELNEKVSIYLKLSFGGVGGAYANYSWTSAALGTIQFEKLVGRAGNYNPSSSEIPLVTAAKGQTGFYYRPFNDYVYYPGRNEMVFFTSNGGASYTNTAGALPFAGSNAGHYVAWGANSFLLSSPSDPLKFSPISLKLPEGEIDMNKYNGANYFTTWGRFGLDNKLYLNLDSKIYSSDQAF